MRRPALRLRQSFRVPSAFIAKQSVVATAVLCAFGFVAQARAEHIKPVITLEDEARGRSFSVELHEDADTRAAHTHAIQNSRVVDRNAYSRKLTFKIDRQSNGPSTGNAGLNNTGIIGNSISSVTSAGDPVTAVPEPSSLLLMSAGLLGLGTLLRSRLADERT